MKDRKPNSPLLFHDDDLKETIEKKTEKNTDFQWTKKLNRKIAVYLNPKSIELTEDEKKKKIGTIIITLIILVLIISSYYFLIYAPSQEALEKAKIEKVNELHSLYCGSLSVNADVNRLEHEIESSNNRYEVEKINIIKPATKAWREHHNKSILLGTDNFNRTMVVSSENNSKMIISIEQAHEIVNTKGAYELSKISFEMPTTVSVPILIKRLQAGGGLLSVGSIVDIYTIHNDNKTSNETNTIKGCTVVSVLRCEESGTIESEYSSTHTCSRKYFKPKWRFKNITTNVLEIIKSSLAVGNDGQTTLSLLDNYGVRLSNCEREINLADLDANYIILVEIPDDDVNYVLENMDQIILTIPTRNAPDWMMNEISSTYK